MISSKDWVEPSCNPLRNTYCFRKRSVWNSSLMNISSIALLALVFSSPALARGEAIESRKQGGDSHLDQYVALNDTHEVKYQSRITLDTAGLQNMTPGGNDLRDSLKDKPRGLKKRKDPLAGLHAQRSATDQCWSKSERKLYHRRFRSKASKAFLQRIRRYEKEHKRCTDPERVKRSFAQDTVQAETVTAKTCKYAIHRGAGGLGNQMQGLVSSFLYALLTNRTLLVERGQDMDLFCEPFAFSSWYLEPEMEQRVMQEMEMRRTNVVELQREREEGRPLPNKAFLFLKWDDSAEEETFFCDDFQVPLANISWLYLHQARYLAPGFVAMESFRSEIERLFPDRMIYTHLARYLLHPNNTFWESITGAYDDYFRTADKRVGIQVRTFAHTDEWANERVLQCAWNVSQVLPPPLDPQAWEELLRQQVPPEQRTEHVRQMSKNNSPRNIFAFVASMHGHHVRHLRWVYMDGIAADGSNVTFHSLSSVEGESWDLNAHAQALLEVWLLSFCDELLTSAHSTFGALAAALAGYPPYLLNIADHAYGKFDDPEDCWRTSKRPVCWRLGSADPCAIPFSRSLCSVEGAQFPPNKPAYLRPCDDQPANWQIYP